MSNVITLPNTLALDVDRSPRNGRIMAFARKLVDDFYASLPGEVRGFSSDDRVFLVGSWEDLMTATEGDLLHYQMETGRSGKEVLTLAFDENLTAERVAAALTFSEEEMREALMVVLVNLRQIDLDGVTPRSERVLDASVAHLVALLEFALSAGQQPKGGLWSARDRP